MKFRNEYITKQLKKSNKEKAFNNIYSRDKILFLLTICLPYFGEIFLSLLIYSCFYHCVFKKKENQKQLKINENALEEENIGLKAHNFGYKKLCGYIFFKESIKKDENSPRYEGECYCCRSLINCFCLECITIILISFRDCLKYTILLTIGEEDDSDYYCKWKCCKGNTCCCCDVRSFGNNESDFGFCYQKQKFSKWFYLYVNNKTQKQLIPFVLFIAFFQLLTIGLDEIYDEKNENNINQDNISLYLLYSCIAYIALCFLIFFIFFRNKSSNKSETYLQFFENHKLNIFKKLSFALAIVTFYNIPQTLSICSLIFSIKYLKDNSSLYNNKVIYLPIFLNKFSIFIISYLILNQNEENEVISNSSLISVYLFIVELIISGIKKISSIKTLMIIQIVFASPIIIYLFLILLILILSILIYICKRNIEEKKEKSIITLNS